MPDRTKQLVDSLLKAPALMELFKRDPARLLTSLAQCKQGQAAIQSGTRIIGQILNQISSSTPRNDQHEAVPPGIGDAGNCYMREAPASGDNSLAVVAVSSLAVITGTLAVLGTASVVAINRRDG